MIRINTLHSLEDIKDIYSVTSDYKILNTNTKKEKKQTLSSKGYLYVTLECNSGKPKKVFVHKIIALAYVNNGPYILINHEDGNTENNIPSNLTFTNHSENGKHAYRIGLVVRREKQIQIHFSNRGSEIGTIKQLSNKLNIPKGTLYDNLYEINKNNKYGIIRIEEIMEGQQTSERGVTA